VRDHIPDFIAIKTSLKDGEVWVHGRYGDPAPLKKAYVRLYVHPKSGLILRNKHFSGWKNLYREARAERAKANEERRRILSENKQLHLFNDGGWWEVTLATIPLIVKERESRHGVQRVSYEKAVEDVVLRAGLSTLSREDLCGRRGVYAKAKRQLSKKEIRGLDLG